MKSTPRLLLALLVTLWPVAAALAQVAPVGLTSQRRPVTFSTSAIYQTYDDGTEVTQVSFPLSLFAPLGRHFSLGLTGGGATTSGAIGGTDIEELTGVGDTQVQLGYGGQVGSGTLVGTVAFNVPTGTSALTTGEFTTAVLMSRNYLGLRLPTYGQGFNVAPGLTWAVPLSDDVAFGLGASYQYKGPFDPLADLGSYDPGDEVLVTAGLDLGVNDHFTLSADVSLTTYGSDKLDDEEVFSPGNKVTVVGQMLGYAGKHRLRLVVLYRTRGKDDVLVGGALVTQDERTLPNEVGVTGTADLHVSDGFTLGLLAGTRLFDATPFEPQRTLLDGGLLPTIHFSNTVSLQAGFIYTYGTMTELTGFEAGGGLAFAW